MHTEPPEINQQIVNWAMLFAQRQINPAWLPVDEAHSVALVGLAKAYQRYNPSSGVPFRVWASIYIRGELLMWMRSALKTLKAESAYAGAEAIEAIAPNQSLLFDPWDCIDSEICQRQILNWARPLLSDIQYQILEGMLAGRSPVDIGRELGISHGKYAYHRQMMVKRLNGHLRSLVSSHD